VDLKEIVDGIFTQGGDRAARGINRSTTLSAVIQPQRYGFKPGMRDRLARVGRALGIRTVMVTGDNRLTAATIAAEAGVDDYVGSPRASRRDKIKIVQSGAGKQASSLR